MCIRHVSRFMRGISVLLAVGLVPASPAHAGGVVTICDEPHLRAALSGGGTVTFACSGVITLTAEIVIAVDTTIDGSGQSVTISGNRAVRVFTVDGGVTLTLNELTVANGYADIDDVRGGGIDNSGTVNATHCTFSGNNAFSAGGGIFNWSGAVIVSDSTFAGNGADQGGGILTHGGTVIVGNSTFAGNSAWYGGGAIANWESGIVVVTNSTFAGNTAYGANGGGIANASGTLTVSNSTFFNNRSRSGGGIDNNNMMAVTNSTFAGNSARDYGGIHSPGPAVLENTIVDDNSPVNCYGSLIDGGGNLSFPDATCPGINADPVLGPLQDNGGPTWTMTLGPGSAAIDAGVDATCAADPVNNRDQRGVVRPQGVHCDSGAFERPIKWLPIMLLQ